MNQHSEMEDAKMFEISDGVIDDAYEIAIKLSQTGKLISPYPEEGNPILYISLRRELLDRRLAGVKREEVTFFLGFTPLIDLDGPENDCNYQNAE